ncbi:hypothetical protein F5Y04DRAFT_281196 [Hypomontagnella monticulosa]|nr:hypothetical protein F5Y04DRAFT_281196 [Hypomontagnella monticulosa]
MTDTRSYSRLASSENEHDVLSPPTQSSLTPRVRKALYFLIGVLNAICMLSFGYFVGVQRERSSRQPPGDLRYTMHFNGSFPQRSNGESDALWASLFPEKLGFVQHPEIAPEVAGIANILRMAFFASLDGTLEEMGDEGQEANHRTSHHHIRHCFEYLRQSLICLADSNLEELNYTTRGVSGWQTERTCRNFEKLKLWADDWGISREEALHRWDLQIQAAPTNER